MRQQITFTNMRSSRTPFVTLLLLPSSAVGFLAPKPVLLGHGTDLEATTSRMQEIVSVCIQENGSPLLPRGNGNDYYVSFLHGDDNDGKSRDSLMLQRSDDDKIQANVNMHIHLGERKPLVAEIYRKIGFWPDRLIGTAQFPPRQLDSNDKYSHITTSIKDPKGKRTGGTLELSMIQKEWEDLYADLDVPVKGDVELFFKAAASVLSDAVKNTKNPTASELLPPEKEADPDLPMASFLGGLLTFPEDGEFVSVDGLTKLKMNVMNKLPFADRMTPYRNRADAIYEIRQVLKDVLLEPPEGRWIDPVEDEQMTRVFFQSLGTLMVLQYNSRSSGI